MTKSHTDVPSTPQTGIALDCPPVDDARHQLQLLMAQNSLTISCQFVPFSLSRNKDQPNLSLNYKVTLLRSNKYVLVTDYSCGTKRTRRECETGQSVPPPEPEGVLSCLILNADVLNYPSFESWAEEFGYDTDSRRAEAIYQNCLAISLQLRHGLGQSLIDTLSELCREL